MKAGFENPNHLHPNPKQNGQKKKKKKKIQTTNTKRAKKDEIEQMHSVTALLIFHDSLLFNFFFFFSAVLLVFLHQLSKARINIITHTLCPTQKNKKNKKLLVSIQANERIEHLVARKNQNTRNEKLAGGFVMELCCECTRFR